MKAFGLTLIGGLVLFAFTAVLAQTPPSESTLTTNPVYTKECAKCHGKTAEGRHFGGPALVSDKAAAASGDDLRNIIANGKGHMPKFAGKLTNPVSQQEIDLDHGRFL